MTLFKENILNDTLFRKEFPFQNRFVEIDGHQIH
jgi:hypothetical protein